MNERPGPARIATLDGLRGLAIGLVLLHHYVQLKLPFATAGWPDFLNRLLTLSWSGVDLFFVLSGFLIGGLLIDHRTSPNLPRVFYLRRGLRILPLYYATLLVLFAWFHLGSFSLLPAWVYALFVSNHGMAWLGSWDAGPLSVMWSLAVEEQFYLVAPWVIRWTPPARLPQVLLALVLLAWLCRLGARLHDPAGFSSHLLMPCRMDAFGFGMLVAWAVRSEAARAWLEKNVPDWRLPLLVAAPPLVGLTCRGVRLDEWHLPLYGYTCLGVFYASLVYVVVVRRPARLTALLSWPPLVSLGRLSYFVYLWHSIIVAGLAHRLLGRVDFTLTSPAAAGVVIASLSLTWALAWISWQCFEGPLIRLGQRHAY